MKWLFLAIAVAACGESEPAGRSEPSTRDAVAASDQGLSVTAEAASDGLFADGSSIDDRARDSSSSDGGFARPQDGDVVSSLTLDALQMIGTHNSYHLAPAIAFDASHKYTQLPLDQQLAGGVRALELDLHLRSDGVFDVYHISIIDPNTSCTTFEECLGVVATWSSAHPLHAPIFIWLELKDDTGGQPINDLAAIENVITKVFSAERLITAASLKGSYASPRERIVAAGWPTIDESRGKVMFAIINRDARTQSYAHDFTTLDDRLMFVNAAPDQLTMPWAAITKVDVGQDDVIAGAHAARVLVATNVCAVNMSDDECQMRFTSAVSSGIHMLHDDLPFAIPGRTYHAELPGGSPGCNTVTAPPGCTPQRIE